jgi:hypothetical protein
MKTMKEGFNSLLYPENQNPRTFNPESTVAN